MGISMTLHGYRRALSLSPRVGANCRLAVFFRVLRDILLCSVESRRNPNTRIRSAEGAIYSGASKESGTDP
jgi:hypothetical protein